MDTKLYIFIIVQTNQEICSCWLLWDGIISGHRTFPKFQPGLTTRSWSVILTQKFTQKSNWRRTKRKKTDTIHLWWIKNVSMKWFSFDAVKVIYIHNEFFMLRWIFNEAVHYERIWKFISSTLDHQNVTMKIIITIVDYKSLNMTLSQTSSVLSLFPISMYNTDQDSVNWEGAIKIS